MNKLAQLCKRAAALAAFAAVVLTGPELVAQTPAAQPAAAQPAAPTKKVKDQIEYELYNEFLKDAATPNVSKQIQDLDTWTQKYPDSDYKDDRLYYYMQAYSKMNPPQPQKVLEYGQQLIGKGLDTVFPGQAGGVSKLTVLFQVAWNAASLGANATPEQIAAGDKAAHELLDFAPKYFVPENKPAGTTDAQWAAARDDIEKRAKIAMAITAAIPGDQASAKKDYAAAEAAYSKALEQYPDNAALSYKLGSTLNAEARANPAKATELAPRAIYAFVRAAVVDPSLGGTADPKKIGDYANAAFAQYHGNDDGLEQLKQQAKASPMPPAGFTIETASAVAARKQQEFVKSNPQLALWMGIKGQLADTNGQQYFEGQLKDADVSGQGGARALKGMVMEGKPACRSKELLVAIPDPNSQGSPRAEITLKLDAALTGKPVAGDIEFDGIPRAFSKEPFMLTMESDKAKITGLKVEPCAPAAARPAPKKGGVTKKK